MIEILNFNISIRVLPQCCSKQLKKTIEDRKSTVLSGNCRLPFKTVIVACTQLNRKRKTGFTGKPLLRILLGCLKLKIFRRRNWNLGGDFLFDIFEPDRRAIWLGLTQTRFAGKLLDVTYK